jgi:ribonuclease VapC
VIAVDTSALCAVLWNEPEAAQMLDALINATHLIASYPTALEWHIVCARRRGLVNAARMDALVDRLGIELIAMDDTLWKFGREGFARYGQGQGGPLNYGDCFSYALAKARDIPLLFKGSDFSQTDVKIACKL